RYLDATINNNISTAVVLTNTKQGYAYSVTLQLERPFKNGLYVKAAYNFGEAKNITNAGSIAVGSWTGNPIGFDPNNAALAFADGDQRHRVIGALSYRKELFNALALQVGIFYEGRNQSRFSYVYNGDMNGDGAFNNELIYVPTTASELNFQQYTSGSATFTVEQQEAAFEAYISQDEYLNSIRGGYAERNGFTLPWLNRMDLNFVVEPFFNVGGKRNSIQLRADVLNFGNLLNSKWGVGQQVINNRPLVARGVNAAGEPVYRFANLGTNLLSSSYRYTNSLSDVWQMQIGIRYIFN
ncbi:MAG: hypothetical protein EAZ89_02270, partial [Bacteroidetes bacterium]